MDELEFLRKLGGCEDKERMQRLIEEYNKGKDAAANADKEQTEKIRTHHARIVVDGTAEKPYYSIEWFDPVKKVHYLGYSSYNIEFVFNWLSECFEIVEEPIQTHADQIRAMSDEELAKLIYSVDGIGWCKSLPECIKQIGLIPEEKCIGCALEWLKQPVEVSGDA